MPGRAVPASPDGPRLVAGNLHGITPMGTGRVLTSRRGFLLGAAGGLAGGIGATTVLDRHGRHSADASAPRFSGDPAEVAKPGYAMPGPYPGRVIEVRDRRAVSDDNVI